jgi:hypothetical protein
MQIPNRTFSSNSLLGLGRFHLAAIEQTPETQPLAAGFQSVYDALLTAKQARENADVALALPRVALTFAEWALEQVLRELAYTAHGADHSTAGGSVFAALFPKNLDAEIRPRGAAQLASAKAVSERLVNQPAAAGLRETFSQRLVTAINDFSSKLTARDRALESLGLARAKEEGAKETFVAAYDSNAGAIRALFPRNRPRQDLYFDVFRARVTASDPIADDEPNADNTP